LGVDDATVTRVVNSLQAQIIYHDRVKAREYYEDNPDAVEPPSGDSGGAWKSSDLKISKRSCHSTRRELRAVATLWEIYPRGLASQSQHPSRVEGRCDRGEVSGVIAAKVDGWSHDYVAKRSRLLSKVLPRVRDMARGAKRRLGNGDLPSGNFTEGWFRTSGLYDRVGSHRRR
jgi:hypothetical protein